MNSFKSRLDTYWHDMDVKSRWASWYINNQVQVQVQVQVNCLDLCRPSVFHQNVFSDMAFVAQLSVTPKKNSPKRLSPNWFFAQPSAPRVYLQIKSPCKNVSIPLLLTLVGRNDPKPYLIWLNCMITSFIFSFDGFMHSIIWNWNYRKKYTHATPTCLPFCARRWNVQEVT